MSRLQLIESALIAINETVFQELCDSFLLLRHQNYRVFSRTGSQTGKQKTIKGTPDSRFLLSDGKYIFVEYSTNVSKGAAKLIEDISKCLDSEKTKIPLEHIAEIIICINFNLNVEEEKSLNAMLADTSISLTIKSLDSLAMEINLEHPNLAHQYLGLSLDKGQVISIKQFVEEYENASNGIATPLNNIFVHREEEIKEFQALIEDNNFIILSGSSGIGKTKLGLEGINVFFDAHSDFKAFCISYKHIDLIDDLNQYIQAKNKSILFVDDANRIDALNQILAFYKSFPKGHLKVVLTVRDYAFQDINHFCAEVMPKHLFLDKLSDAEIVDIVKQEPFGILNSDYHDKILSISNGNPRLAIMTALLSRAKNDISALSNVADLFEEYFSKLVLDSKIFAEKESLKCLGIIAFFYAIPYRDKEKVSSILEKFDISYDVFIEFIKKLEELELLQRNDEYIKIGEQNLSTYFFYKAFIKNDVLSFKTLLLNYFHSHSNRFLDCVIPSHNIFGSKSVMDKLQLDLKNFWTDISHSEKEAFDFLTIFWFYLRSETLTFLFQLIESFPVPLSVKYNVKYHHNAFAYKRDDCIELIGEFFRVSVDVKDAIGLSFEYIRKKPEHLPELIHKIREVMVFNRYDVLSEANKQSILFSFLIDGVDKGDELFVIVFYELAKTFLKFSFHFTKAARNDSMVFGDYVLPKNEFVLCFREKLWNAINHNFSKYPDESFSVLKQYIVIMRDIHVQHTDLLSFDIDFIVTIINKLDKNNFEHCKYVHDLLDICKKKNVKRDCFSELLEAYTNDIYKLYEKLDWRKLNGVKRDRLDREYDSLKENEIRSSFLFNNQKEIEKFYENFVCFKKTETDNVNHQYNNVLNIILDENFSRNFDVGCILLSEIIKNGNEVELRPFAVFKGQLNNKDKANCLWELIQEYEFKWKSLWAFWFCECIDDSLVSAQYADGLIFEASSMQQWNNVDFSCLRKFISINVNLFEILLKIFFDENKKLEMKMLLPEEIFIEHIDLLGEDISFVKKVYLEQSQIDVHYDFNGEGLFNILKKDSNFLIEYVEFYYNIDGVLSGRDKDLQIVWEYDGMASLMVKVFDIVIARRRSLLGYNKCLANMFFCNSSHSSFEPAKEFLFDYCKNNHSAVKKMNLVLDIVRHSMKEIFEEFLLFFLNLNCNIKVFEKIQWRDGVITWQGDTLAGDVEAADWRNILSIVEKSDMGIKLIPIKNFLNNKIQSCQEMSEREKKRRFLENR